MAKSLQFDIAQCPSSRFGSCFSLSIIDWGERARTIVRAFCRMCMDNGFYENFDAKTGAGHYDTACTWTSSVFMIFANRYV